jgi:uncharacterized protein YjbJ (UPF0337 family)
MDENRIKGKIKEIEGQAQVAIGNVTHSNSDKIEGAIKKVEGAIQNEYGKAKDAVRKAKKTA